MDREDRPTDSRGNAVRPLPDELREPRHGELDRLVDTDDEDAGTDVAGSARDVRLSLIEQGGLPENPGEQEEFREQFDEDLYNDREDRPAQGNTADVAMGDQRFGSEADAYSEYAWRRPGDHHSGDASSVGQARDPADISGEDERP